MKVLPLSYPAGRDQLLSLFELSDHAAAGLRVGTARIEQGRRVPETAYSSHGAHEVSVIMKGLLSVEIAGQLLAVKAGDVTVIEPGEAHSALALEDTEVFWILFGPLGGGE